MSMAFGLAGSKSWSGGCGGDEIEVLANDNSRSRSDDKNSSISSFGVWSMMDDLTRLGILKDMLEGGARRFILFSFWLEMAGLLFLRLTLLVNENVPLKLLRLRWVLVLLVLVPELWVLVLGAAFTVIVGMVGIGRYRCGWSRSSDLEGAWRCRLWPLLVPMLPLTRAKNGSEVRQEATGMKDEWRLAARGAGGGIIECMVE
jgi:hypothetical protein